MFLKIFQDSQENTCARNTFLIILQTRLSTKMFFYEFWEIFLGHLFWRTSANGCFWHLRYKFLDSLQRCSKNYIHLGDAFHELLDQHTLLKKKVFQGFSIPYQNKAPRKVVYNWSELRNKFWATLSSCNQRP